MRSLIIIIAAFLIMICLITLNYLHLNKTAEEMTELTLSLNIGDTEKCAATIAAIEEIWQKNEAIFSLSVSFKEIDRLGETILSLKSAFESQNRAEFRKQRALLKDAIDGVARLERFSVLNIF